MVSIGPKYVKKIPGFYIISILVQNYEKSDEKKIKQKIVKIARRLERKTAVDYSSRNVDFSSRKIDFSSRKIDFSSRK